MRPNRNLVETQSLAAQQAFNGLLGIARARLAELEVRERDAQSVDGARTVREALRSTRRAISAAERL